MSDINELYQELIIDHGRHPRNFAKMPEADLQKEGFNPLCGDRLTLFLRVKNDIIESITFDGAGCAISIASASLLTESLKGKSFSEAKKLFHVFHSVLIGKESADVNVLGKLSAFKGVCDYPMRVKCATLAWQTLISMIDKRGRLG